MTSTRQPSSEGPDSSRAPFATTRWTVVLAAGGPSTAGARLALEELCRAYWRPIYAYVRRLGHSTHDAQDLTQDFFARLLAPGGIDRVHPSKGRFRSFLLVALKHFLANEWDKARALKRGGGVTFIPLDASDTDAGLPLESSPGEGPERLYDRQWALAVLDRVLGRLREEYHTGGKGVLFDKLRETLVQERHSVPYAVLASELHLTEGAVKVSVHRLRQRYRELLRIEIVNTVSNPDQVEDELRDLFTALTG